MNHKWKQLLKKSSVVLAASACLLGSNLTVYAAEAEPSFVLQEALPTPQLTDTVAAVEISQKADAKDLLKEQARKERQAAREAAQRKAQRAARRKAARQAREAKRAEEARIAERQRIVDYALQFVGNPYVYGGTSLTNGADCSGFVMSVFGDCGYTLPRVASSQAYSGTAKPLEELEAGDLVFYASGSSIYHVGLYIGEGEIVHASTAATGIKISNYDYTTPYMAATYLA